MEWVALVTMVAVLQLIVFAGLTGRARGTYGVAAPAVTGHEMFERFYRVHYNSIEQFIVFLPSLWTFGWFVGWYWAAGLGAIYVVGRTIYAIEYIREPASRGPGMILTILPAWGMAVGSCVAVLMHL